MSTTAIVLVLVSAVVHASWNLLGKRSRPVAPFFAVASLTGAVLIAPFAVAWSRTLVQIPLRVWLLLLPAGFFQMLYFTGLAGAYRTGDMSVAYPIARALPVLLVPAVSLILGQGEPLGFVSLAGMLAVTLGVVTIMQRSFASFSWFASPGPWFAFALLAGIGTTGYSMVDDAALSLFRESVGPNGGNFQAPILYAMFESISTTLFLCVSTTVVHGPRQLVRDLRSIDRRTAAVSGVGIVSAYALVLVAFGFARNVSYVVAFRQISLPIGALLSVGFLRERLNAPRIVGTLVIVAGLVAIALE